MACHKAKLGMFDPKARSYRGAHLHDFRGTAASNLNANGIQEGKAKTGSQDKFNVQMLGRRRVGVAARRARCSDRVIEYLD
jgi:hypothetical protein